MPKRSQTENVRDTSSFTARLALLALCLQHAACVGSNDWDYQGGEAASPDERAAVGGDRDGDSISDEHEGSAVAEDTDGDGTPDYLDNDSDNDGLHDSIEAGDSDPSTRPVDSDGDGVPDFRDTDSDGNGIFDIAEGSGDTDHDGEPDFQDNDDDGDGILDRIELGGSPAAPPDSDADGVPDYRDADDGVTTSPEICDSLDNDGNGEIDEGCICEPDTTQPCYGGPVATRGVGECRDGTQLCVAEGEFSLWGLCESMVTPTSELCDDDLDNDCDGLADCLDEIDCGPCREDCTDGEDDDFDGLVDCEDPDCPPCAEICDNGIDDDLDGLIDCDDPDCPCMVEVDVDLYGDCLYVNCPGHAPYPVGCNITMHGGDERGCVASTPTNSRVYFQEGDACGAGHLTGTLFCSSEVGVGLNWDNCRINKEVRYYPRDRSGCPETDG